MFILEEILIELPILQTGVAYSMYDFQIERGTPFQRRRHSSICPWFERENLPTNLTKADALQLRGKVLGCHCKPLACHGDILADYLNRS